MGTKNISTILALIVTLGGCQTIIPESFLNQSKNAEGVGTEADQAADETISYKNLPSADQVMLAVEELHPSQSDEAAALKEKVTIPASIDSVSVPSNVISQDTEDAIK
jgi:uncharacterized protein YceK